MIAKLGTLMETLALPVPLVVTWAIWVKDEPFFQRMLTVSYLAYPRNETLTVWPRFSPMLGLSLIRGLTVNVFAAIQCP